MKPISPTIHGIIDYATVVLFLAAPSLLGFVGTAALLSYLLAGVHLLMTVLSNMPLGLMKLVPMRLHGLVELIVGPSCLDWHSSRRRSSWGQNLFLPPPA